MAMATVVAISTFSASALSLRKADGANGSIEGKWTFVFGDFYFSDSAQDFISVDYTATLDGDSVTFKTTAANRYQMVAWYDEATQVLTFTREALGTLKGLYLFQQPFVYNWQTQAPEAVESINGQYYPELGVMSFPQDSGIKWDAFNNQTSAGQFDILDLMSATYLDADTKDYGSWTDLGNAVFMDGWLCPYFGIDQTANLYEVPLQQNVANPNLYRLVNPYQYGPVKKYNSSKADGSIMFDVTDPDHVVFLTADAGFMSIDLGISTFYCYNQLGSLAAKYPQYTIDQIVGLQEGYTPWTTFSNGVVSLTSIVSINGVKVYDANFGTQVAIFGGIGWIDDTGSPVNMDAKIIFPTSEENGVGSVNVETEEAKVYYNLQGLPVSDPKPGQILICNGKKIVF